MKMRIGIEAETGGREKEIEVETEAETETETGQKAETDTAIDELTLILLTGKMPYIIELENQ